jgi:hypothetical protein
VVGTQVEVIESFEDTGTAIPQNVCNTLISSMIQCARRLSLQQCCFEKFRFYSVKVLMSVFVFSLSHVIFSVFCM